jgi:hypothetical protein
MNNETRRRLTKAEKLRQVLLDHQWHSTKELARRVGHTFAVAKRRLGLSPYFHTIELRRHQSKRYQYEYRLMREPSLDQ